MPCNQVTVSLPPERMSLLSQIDLASMQEWPLKTTTDLFKAVNDLEASHRICQENEACQRLLIKRNAPQEENGMPVVFIPQKSQTECERVSKLSSFGFMSFVLAIVNGVISVSNNINNNNNNRNNNNNDDNNNQFNTNLGNTNNVQMAGGMAMSMRRRLIQLEKIEAIRDRLRRKMGLEVEEGSNNSNIRVPNLVAAPTQASSIKTEAAYLLEELYQKEVVEKAKTGESVRQQVAELLQKMYEEQKAKIEADSSFNRQSRNLSIFNLEEDCMAASKLVFQSSLIGLAFIQLWVDIHENDLDHGQLSSQLCDILEHSKAYGKLPLIVAKTMKDHLLFLLDDNVDCLN